MSILCHYWASSNVTSPFFTVYLHPSAQGQDLVHTCISYFTPCNSFRICNSFPMQFNMMKALTLQVLSGTFAMQIPICSQASQYREKCWNGNGDQGLSWCWTQRSGPPSRMLSSSPRLPECVSGGILEGPLKQYFLCIQQWWDYARKGVSPCTSSWAAWGDR